METTAGIANVAIVEGDPKAPIFYGPAPPWVHHAPAPAVADRALEDFTDQGVLRILHDTQLSLLGPGVLHHIRAVQRVLTRAGAERAASLAIEFDPSEQNLEIHSIRVFRDEQSIEHACPGAMQLLRRESQLERSMLNGRLTANFVVPDLREGDGLEVSFTLRSTLSALQGRYGGWLVFNAYAPWLETRVRLIRPVSRTIVFKPFNGPPEARTTAVDGQEEICWVLTGQRRRPPQDLVPSWTVTNPCYQASEFSSWGEVARLFSSHYLDDELPPSIESACAELASLHSDPATLAVEWLRYVQRSLRYFALVSGDGNLLPRDLETIWSRRFGDCKDAARLYVAGARRMGLDAAAALVSTTHGLVLNEFLPAAHVFNHVIVRLRVVGETFWLDPTSAVQTGALRQLVTSHPGWALPLTPDSEALEALPIAKPLQLIHCEDRYTLGRNADSPAKLTRRMTFSYWAADAIRHRIANDGASKVATLLLQEFRASWPQARETVPPSFEDESRTNELVMACGFELPRPWTETEEPPRHCLMLADTVTGNELAKLAITQRVSPILLGRPRQVSWRAVVEMPRRWPLKGWHRIVEAPGLRFTSVLDGSGREITVDRQLVVSAWSIAADQADGYTRVVTASKRNATQLFSRVSRRGRIAVVSDRWKRMMVSIGWRILLLLAASLVVAIVAKFSDHTHG